MSMIFRKAINRLQGIAYQTPKYCTAVENHETKAPDVLPVISKLEHDASELYQKPRQVWLENLDTAKEKKLGLVTLHPHVYAAAPRIDIIHQNVRWQKFYRWVVSVIITLI